MPAASSFLVTLNFEPQVASIEATPNNGSSLSTWFQISLLQVEDEDVPITYKFYLYPDVKKKKFIK
jgi:hypothetical protein